MRCLFCRKDATGSRSAEHIVPESLGNKAYVLRPGIVCDTCNNYFAREVERPFLDAPAVRSLRFRQSIPNKRGRVPPLDAILAPHFPAVFNRNVKAGLTFLSLEPEGVQHILTQPSGKLVLPGGAEPPPSDIVSRFLAKVALEAMASRIQHVPEWLADFISEAQFDPLRRYAREGVPKTWMHHVRRIYDENRPFVDERGQEVQTVHEFDILVADSGEWFFVLALFGLELTINVGGPDISGYLAWLDANSGASPLYWGKNAPHT